MAKKTPTKATVTPINKRRTEDKTTSIKIRIDTADETTIYSNYMEVGHSEYEFMLSVARMPTKLNPTAIALAKDRGEVVLEPQIQILFPARIISGLISALEIERDKYETRFGKIPGAEKK